MKNDGVPMRAPARADRVDVGLDGGLVRVAVERRAELAHVDAADLLGVLLEVSRVSARWFSKRSVVERPELRRCHPARKTSRAASAAGIAFWWKGSG